MKTRRARALAMVSLLVAGAFVAACGRVKSPTEPGPGGGGAAFTFARIQAEILTPNCAKSGCHDVGSASAGLNLTAGAGYAQLVNRRSTERSSLDRIEPGDPERSYLVKKIRGDADIAGERMPQDGPPYLSARQIDGIIAWVRAGAPND